MILKIPQATSKGYIEVEPYGAFDWTYPNSLTRRGRVQGAGGVYLPHHPLHKRDLCYNGMIPIIILGSLQDHAVRVDIRGGVILLASELRISDCRK